MVEPSLQTKVCMSALAAAGAGAAFAAGSAAGLAGMGAVLAAGAAGAAAGAWARLGNELLTRAETRQIFHKLRIRTPSNRCDVTRRDRRMLLRKT
ncbi:hypothetical protein CTTA_1823 [Comamonas testosteroni]|uniref:Uncharacterized protein n=1 Tax=Comamonas testosteroni TaxID=285 RepID=A0A5A7MAE0_COMTE|nr:hypothetical protein CTTA_1823 [Comamonas testosteroni]